MAIIYVGMLRGKQKTEGERKGGERGVGGLLKKECVVMWREAGRKYDRKHIAREK